MINLILLLIIGIFCFLIFKNSKKAKLQALENEKLAADFLANNPPKRDASLSSLPSWTTWHQSMAKPTASEFCNQPSMPVC